MNVGFALGLGAVTTLGACMLKEQSEEGQARRPLGCKCRAKMDPTFEMNGHEIGCPYHDYLEELEEQRAMRGARRNSRAPQALRLQTFNSSPFGASYKPAYNMGRSSPAYGMGQLTIPPGVNCQRTREGGMICSDGTGFPPNCTQCPGPNYPGTAAKAERINPVTGILELIDVPPPPATGGGAAAGGQIGGIPLVPLAIGGGLLALLLLS